MPEEPDPPQHGMPRTREEIARFVIDRKARIQAIARRRLAAGSRGLFDSEDVVASVMRRIDQMASRGALRLRSEGELWALIATIAGHDAITKARIMARSNSIIREDHEFAKFLVERASNCESDEAADAAILDIAASISNATMRQVFLLRLRGASHEAAAGAVGMTPAAVRQQWSTLMRSLSERFASPRSEI